VGTAYYSSQGHSRISYRIPLTWPLYVPVGCPRLRFQGRGS